MSTPRSFELAPSHSRAAVLQSFAVRGTELAMGLAAASVGAVLFVALVLAWSGRIPEMVFASIAALVSAAFGIWTPVSVMRALRGDLRKLRESGRAITRTERALLTGGELIYGKIEALDRDAGTVSVVFTGPDGQPATRTIEPYRKETLDDLTEGTPLPLFIDPSTRGCVAPTLLEVTFEAPREELDLRPSALELPPLSEPGKTAATRIALYRALRPIAWPWWARLARRITRQKTDTNTPASIALSGSILSMEHKGTGETQQLDLNRPFRVVLSFWPLEDGRAELSVALHQGSEALFWRTPMAQSSLDRRIPTQKTQASWMKGDDFEALWPGVRYHAALHGDDPGSIAL